MPTQTIFGLVGPALAQGRDFAEQVGHALVNHEGTVYRAELMGGR